MLKQALLTALAATVAAHGQTVKQWRSQEEFRLAADSNASANPKDRLSLLDTWEQLFPDSDYADVRDFLYVVTYQQLNDCRNASEKAADLLDNRPFDYTALSAIEGCI